MAVVYWGVLCHSHEADWRFSAWGGGVPCHLHKAGWRLYVGSVLSQLHETGWRMSARCV
jgi:hypothetical protein